MTARLSSRSSCCRRLAFEPLEPRQMLSGASYTIVDTFQREAVRTAFAERYQSALTVPLQWTGNVARCNAGAPSDAFQDATLQMINFFRGMAGLPGVSLDPSLSEKAQQAALIMDAQNALSHNPPSRWQCYSADGALAASRSNLYLGITGPAAIAGYIEDPGSGNTAVGHRRWILYPPQVQMGSGSTSRANALWVVGNAGTRPGEPAWVSWPPQGFVPYQLVYPRWSLSKNDVRAWSVDFSQATVEMKANERIVPVQVHTVFNGYGDNTLVWEPQGTLFQPRSLDVTYQVTVSNIVVDGVTQEFSYLVTIIDPSISIPGGILPGPDDYETNDSFATATDVAAGDRTIGELTIHVPDDRDVFHWSPDTNGPIRATLSVADSRPTMQLSLYDGDQRLLQSVRGAEGTLSLSTDGLASGPFFIIVDGDGQTLVSDYQLKLEGFPRPLARDDRSAAERHTSVTVNALANDSSETGLIVPGSLQIVSAPVHGKTMIDPTTGSVTYTPDSDFVGLDRVRYVVADERGNFSLPATISITVLDPRNRPWQSPLESLDVNVDGLITSIDALIIINHLNAFGSSRLHIDFENGVFPPMYLDASGDGCVTPADALRIINFLNAASQPEATGQAAGAWVAPQAQFFGSEEPESGQMSYVDDLATDALLACPQDLFRIRSGSHLRAVRLLR